MAVTPQEKADELLTLLQKWRAEGTVPACPECAATHLEIKDLSARPHTEWYRFQCADCGFNETVALPHASSGQTGIN